MRQVSGDCETEFTCLQKVAKTLRSERPHKKFRKQGTPIPGNGGLLTHAVMTKDAAPVCVRRTGRQRCIRTFYFFYPVIIIKSRRMECEVYEKLQMQAYEGEYEV